VQSLQYAWEGNEQSFLGASGLAAFGGAGGVPCSGEGVSCWSVWRQVCELIDLHVGELLCLLFRLPYRFVTPDMVAAELEEPDGETVVGLGLVKETLSGEQLLEIRELRGRYRGVSANDAAALLLARDLGITLLTGDGQLRKAAKLEKVSVHGTLWVMDEMLGLGVIAESEAAASMECMLGNGRRLPIEECRPRLKRWKSKQISNLRGDSQ